MNKIRIIILIFLLAGYATANAQQRAKPKEGDGIMSFLRRYNCNTPALRKEFLRINKNKLTKDGGLVLGRTYILPTGSATLPESDSPQRKKTQRTISEPLFGKAHQQVKVISDELKGACLYLVSGHGGPDPGAIGRVGKYELHEDEYAYDIILRLGRSLMQRGATVHFIIQDAKDGIRSDRYLNNSKRETCMGRPIPLDQLARLKQRCDAINKLTWRDKERYKRAVFIHVDSRGEGDRVDVFFYHCKGSRFGKRLADNIHRTFDNKYDQHQPNRGFYGTVSERNLYVLKNTTPPAVFLELGNIQNAKDRQRLILESNRQALADWICQGIVKDFKQ